MFGMANEGKVRVQHQGEVARGYAIRITCQEAPTWRRYLA